MKNENNQESAAFFSVKFSCIIGGGQFRPSICYAIPHSLKAKICEMADQGLAKLYDNEVRFVSGVARPMPVAAQPAEQLAPEAVPEQSTAAQPEHVLASQKASRRGRK